MVMPSKHTICKDDATAPHQSASGLQVPQVAPKEERRVLAARERRFEGRDEVAGARVASAGPAFGKRRNPQDLAVAPLKLNVRLAWMRSAQRQAVTRFGKTA